MNIFLFLLALGCFGVLTISVAFPLLALLLIKLPKAKYSCACSYQKSNTDSGVSLNVIIPAHNEASTIGATIQSIKDAFLNLKIPGITLSIFVAADGCNDNTAEIASLSGATVIINPINIGKWRTIESLLKNSEKYGQINNNSWTAIVDAGAIWPANLIEECLKHFRNPDCTGIAPSYRVENAGLIERLSWKYEKLMKSIENLSGGPVSVHGATVIYRSHALRKTLDFLHGESWLNDDVVIPLAMRSLFAHSHIAYLPDICVSDRGVTKAGNEMNRRRRLVIGNLQWISKLWLRALRLNPVAACLGLRRICRVLWAYWALALVISVFYCLLRFNPVSTYPFNISLPVAAMALLILSLPRSVNSVFTASLLSPIYLISKYSLKEFRWK